MFYYLDRERPQDLRAHTSYTGESGVIIRIVGDGNCLFNAVVLANHYLEFLAPCPGYLSSSAALRQAVIVELQKPENLEIIRSTLSDERNIVPDAIPENDLQAYLNKMAQPGTWGGTPEIIVVAKLLQKRIIVHQNGKVVHLPPGQDYVDWPIAMELVHGPLNAGLTAEGDPDNHYNLIVSPEIAERILSTSNMSATVKENKTVAQDYVYSLSNIREKGFERYVQSLQIIEEKGNELRRYFNQVITHYIRQNLSILQLTRTIFFYSYQIKEGNEKTLVADFFQFQVPSESITMAVQISKKKLNKDLQLPKSQRDKFKNFELSVQIAEATDEQIKMGTLKKLNPAPVPITGTLILKTIISQIAFENDLKFVYINNPINLIRRLKADRQTDELESIDSLLPPSLPRHKDYIRVFCDKFERSLRNQLGVIIDETRKARCWRVPEPVMLHIMPESLRNLLTSELKHLFSNQVVVGEGDAFDNDFVVRQFCLLKIQELGHYLQCYLQLGKKDYTKPKANISLTMLSQTTSDKVVVSNYRLMMDAEGLAITLERTSGPYAYQDIVQAVLQSDWAIQQNDDDSTIIRFSNINLENHLTLRTIHSKLEYAVLSKKFKKPNVKLNFWERFAVDNRHKNPTLTDINITGTVLQEFIKKIYVNPIPIKLNPKICETLKEKYQIQQDAIKKVLMNANVGLGTLAYMPTASGKTYTAIYSVLGHLTATDSRTKGKYLVVVPGDGVKRNWLETFEDPIVIDVIKSYQFQQSVFKEILDSNSLNKSHPEIFQIVSGQMLLNWFNNCTQNEPKIEAAKQQMVKYKDILVAKNILKVADDTSSKDQPWFILGNPEIWQYIFHDLPEAEVNTLIRNLEIIQNAEIDKLYRVQQFLQQFQGLIIDESHELLGSKLLDGSDDEVCRTEFLMYLSEKLLSLIPNALVLALSATPWPTSQVQIQNHFRFLAPQFLQENYDLNDLIGRRWNTFSSSIAGLADSAFKEKQVADILERLEKNKENAAEIYTFFKPWMITLFNHLCFYVPLPPTEVSKKSSIVPIDFIQHAPQKKQLHAISQRIIESDEQQQDKPAVTQSKSILKLFPLFSNTLLGFPEEKGREIPWEQMAQTSALLSRLFEQFLRPEIEGTETLDLAYAFYINRLEPANYLKKWLESVCRNYTHDIVVSIYSGELSKYEKDYCRLTFNRVFRLKNLSIYLRKLYEDLHEGQKLTKQQQNKIQSMTQILDNLLNNADVRTKAILDELHLSENLPIEQVTLDEAKTKFEEQSLDELLKNAIQSYNKKAPPNIKRNHLIDMLNALIISYLAEMRRHQCLIFTEAGASGIRISAKKLFILSKTWSEDDLKQVKGRIGRDRDHPRIHDVEIIEFNSGLPFELYTLKLYLVKAFNDQLIRKATLNIFDDLFLAQLLYQVSRSNTEFEISIATLQEFNGAHIRERVKKIISLEMYNLFEAFQTSISRPLHMELSEGMVVPFEDTRLPSFTAAASMLSEIMDNTSIQLGSLPLVSQIPGSEPFYVGKRLEEINDKPITFIMLPMRMPRNGETEGDLTPQTFLEQIEKAVAKVDSNRYFFVLIQLNLPRGNNEMMQQLYQEAVAEFHLHIMPENIGCGIYGAYFSKSTNQKAKIPIGELRNHLLNTVKELYSELRHKGCDTAGINLISMDADTLLTTESLHRALRLMEIGNSFGTNGYRFSETPLMEIEDKQEYWTCLSQSLWMNVMAKMVYQQDGMRRYVAYPAEPMLFLGSQSLNKLMQFSDKLFTCHPNGYNVFGPADCEGRHLQRNIFNLFSGGEHGEVHFFGPSENENERPIVINYARFRIEPFEIFKQPGNSYSRQQLLCIMKAFYNQAQSFFKPQFVAHTIAQITGLPAASLSKLASYFYLRNFLGILKFNFRQSKEFLHILEMKHQNNDVDALIKDFAVTYYHERFDELRIFIKTVFDFTTLAPGVDPFAISLILQWGILVCEEYINSFKEVNDQKEIELNPHYPKQAEEEIVALERIDTTLENSTNDGHQYEPLKRPLFKSSENRTSRFFSEAAPTTKITAKQYQEFIEQNRGLKRFFNRIILSTEWCIGKLTASQVELNPELIIKHISDVMAEISDSDNEESALQSNSMFNTKKRENMESPQSPKRLRKSDSEEERHQPMMNFDQ